MGLISGGGGTEIPVLGTLFRCGLGLLNIACVGTGRGFVKGGGFPEEKKIKKYATT